MKYTWIRSDKIRSSIVYLADLNVSYVDSHLNLCLFLSELLIYLSIYCAVPNKKGVRKQSGTYFLHQSNNTLNKSAFLLPD